MISRVAESSFWLNRYIERIENTARLLRVHRSFVLDVDMPGSEGWQPVLVVSGEKPRFEELHGTAAMEDGEAVQEYLVWDEECPVSTVASLRWARENARTIREIISVDAWESLNEFWYWMRRGPGRRLYNKDRDAFYQHVRDWPHELYGICHATMMHDEAFDFMRLGMLLERAGQTARLLDVRHHLLLDQADPEHPAVEASSWLVLLRSCSAIEPFHKRHQEATSARNVAGFLLLERAFPRSVSHCIDRASNFLNRIATGEDINPRSAKTVDALRSELRDAGIDRVLENGLHNELTRLVERIAEICDEVHRDFFALKRPDGFPLGAVS